MSIPKRAPCTAWFLRRPVSRYPNGYITTEEDEMVRITYFEHRNYPVSMWLTRRDARLLAKRLNQCLDETTKP